MRPRIPIASMAAAILFSSAAALAQPPPIEPEHHRRAEPVPIPGGIQIPGGPLIHVFIPGPESIPLHMGLHVEPSTITHFDGFTAVAFMAGTATDGNGHRYHAEYDMRIFQGDYLAADGTHHHGTFGFV